MDGITFTGSFDVGMGILPFLRHGRLRPTYDPGTRAGRTRPSFPGTQILKTQAVGIVRSAFGLQGQKCSACSRVFVEEPVYEQLVERVVALTQKLTVGDPAERETYMGPVINKSSYEDFKGFCQDLKESGKIATGGEVITEGKPGAKVTSARPTVAVDVPITHKLWQQEMFVPITMIHPVKDLKEAIETGPNSTRYGLTAGFLRHRKKKVGWFLR